MFFDYFRLYGVSGSAQSYDFMWRLLFVIVFALILAVIGFKVKRPWGAAFPLVYGVIVYLANR